MDSQYTEEELFDEIDSVVRPSGLEPTFIINDTNLDIASLSVDSQQFLSPDSCHMEGVVERGQLEVNVKKVNIARSNSAVRAGMPCYTMTSKPRGLALIIEIDKYDNDVYEPRIGSNVSV
jgi:hypothetical protein